MLGELLAGHLEEATAAGPASLEQAIYSLPHQAAFTEKSTEFMRLLRPSRGSFGQSVSQKGKA